MQIEDQKSFQFYLCISNFSYFADECDDETCQDLSETIENTHTQIDTENHGLAPSIGARRNSNSDTG